MVCQLLRYLLILHLLYLPLQGFSQQKDFNLEFVGNARVPFPDSVEGSYKTYTDVWGWVAPDGTEYAIMGTGTGTSIFGLQDPSNPVLLFSVPGSWSRWRDMKTYQEYLYVVADEGIDGLLVVDMSMAPDSVTWNFWRPELTIAAEPFILAQCHNLYIDSSYAYLAGCNGPGGTYIFDLGVDPMSPPLVSATDPLYAHDVYVQDDRLYASNLRNGFSIVDISAIDQPVSLAFQETSANFTHNAWASPDNRYLFTTDEVNGAYVEAYDVSDPDEIIRLDQFRPAATRGLGVIPHNVHYHNGYLITSYYTDGIKIIDANQPDNLVEVGSYDTYFTNDGTFGGAWGAYPFLPSGLVLVSDRSTGLYVLQPTYQRASYVQGMVRDSVSGELLAGVEITFLSDKPGYEETDTDGRFKTGLADTGLQVLSFFRWGYAPKKISVDLVAGSTTSVDVTLRPLQTFTVSGIVIDDESGEPIDEAPVILQNGIYRNDISTSSAGTFMLRVYEGAAILAAGKWGYLHEFVEVDLQKNESDLEIRLKRGYRDDFVFEYGWQVQNSQKNLAQRGWQRGTPGYAMYKGEPANPDRDVDGDFGDDCYVTGLDNNLWSNVADTSVLQSPTFDLLNYEDPFLYYYLWYYVNGVNPPDDVLEVFIGNGEEEVLVERLDDYQSGWRDRSSIRILDFLTPSAEMYLKVVATDAGNINICEAGLDAFVITEGMTTPVYSSTIDWMSVYPNPFCSEITVQLSDGKDYRYKLTDIAGRTVLYGSIGKDKLRIPTMDIHPGMYVLTVLGRDGIIASRKVLKM